MKTYYGVTTFTMYLELPETTRQRLRVLQIISVALIMGIALFAAITLVTPATGPVPPTNDLRLMAFAWFGVCAIIAPCVQIAGPHIAVRYGNSEEIKALFDKFFVINILCLALLEGAALFSAVVHMLSRDPIDLIPVGAAILIMIGVHFPFEGRFIRFIEVVREKAQRL